MSNRDDYQIQSLPICAKLSSRILMDLMRKKCTFDNHRIFHSCHISGTRGRPLGEEKEKYRGVDLAKLYLSSFLHCCFFKNFSFSFLLKNSVSTFRNWWVIITALEALIPIAQNLILFFSYFIFVNSSIPHSISLSSSSFFFFPFCCRD